MKVVFRVYFKNKDQININVDNVSTALEYGTCRTIELDVPFVVTNLTDEEQEWLNNQFKLILSEAEEIEKYEVVDMVKEYVYNIINLNRIVLHQAAKDIDINIKVQNIVDESNKIKRNLELLVEELDK